MRLKRTLISICAVLVSFVAFADDPKPEGGPYKETVEGIEWTFMVTNGEASVGGGSYAAVAQSTVGLVDIPATLGGRPVTRIGDWAFWNCADLTGVTIPEGVTSIGCMVFYLADSIAEIDIPASVTNIEEGAFYACFDLGDICVAEGNQHYVSYDGVLYDKDGTSLVCCPPAKTSVSLLTSVTNICTLAFGECCYMESITLPPHLATLGNDVFYSCKVAALTFPSSVIRVGRNMFPGCDSLDTVYFEGLPPENVYYEDFLNWQGFDLPKRVIAIRYNIAYEKEWQELVQLRGLTNAKYYLLGKKDLTASDIETWVVDELAVEYAKAGETASEYVARFKEKFGDDYSKTFVKETGKVSAAGAKLGVWSDYVAGTDPLDLTSQIKTLISFENGVPVVTWDPNLGLRREYKVWGRESLSSGSSWQNPTNSLHRFFKVTVEMPK